MEATFGPFLTNTFGDRYLYGINRDAFNQVGSENLFRRQFGDLLKEDRFHVVIGTDSGLLPRYLLKAGVPQGARYLFVEHPEVLGGLREELDPQILGERIACTTYDRYQEQAIAWNISSYIFLGSVLLHQSIAAQDDFPGIYQELVWNVRKEIKQFVWSINHSLGSEVFIQKQFENLGENRHSAKYLKDLFSGKTAVLLAGGPSLDEILPWLKENRDRVTVLAVSRVSRRLQEVGIAPDLIFSIDPHPVSFDVSKETLTFWKESVLVHMYHVTPQLLGQWRGRSLFLGPRFLWDTPMNSDCVSAPGPTVTNTALGVAVEMGFSQVILSGVDLCFSREGFTHAEGSNERKAGPQLGRTCMQVRTNGGWLAETDHDLYSAIHQLSQQARRALDRGCRFINTASGAAQVEHVLFQSLETIEIQPLDEPARHILEQALPEESSESRASYYGQVLEELALVGMRLRRIEKLAAEGLNANDGLFGRQGKRADFRHKVRMDRIEKKINRDEEFSRLLKRFGIRHFLGATRLDPDREWTDEEVEKVGRIYYGAYRASARNLLEMIRKAEERLAVRREEEKKTPDLDRLLRQWTADHQPGRSLLWQDRHGEEDGLTAEARSGLEALEETFRKILEAQETNHFRRCRSYAGLGNIGAKARGLFQLRDVDGLEALGRGLSAHPESESEWYGALVKGYLAELQEDPSEALCAYHRIIDASYPPLLEDALRRIASLSLAGGETGDALLALDCLAAVSPAYMLQYADLLRLTGENRRALEIYADYLEKVPEDLTAMMKLGLFYRQLGIEEGAELMFRYILEKDPGNSAAGRFLAELEEKGKEKEAAFAGR